MDEEYTYYYLIKWFEIKKPAATAIKPPATLATMYNKKLVYNCCCSILNASNENAEKVVKPPQMPTAKNFHKLESIAFF